MKTIRNFDIDWFVGALTVPGIVAETEACMVGSTLFARRGLPHFLHNFSHNHIAFQSGDVINK